MGKLAYFPFRVPPQEVLHQSLLYWDGVATVLPSRAGWGYDPTPEGLRDLEERGLYLGLRWMDYNGALSSSGGVLVDELNRMAAGANPPQPSQRVFLEAGKMFRGLEDLLVRLGLAEWSGEWGFGVVTSQEVIDVIIGTLIRDIVAEQSRVWRRGEALYPYTDRDDAWRCALRTAPEGGLDRPTTNWELEIGRILPVPAPGTTTEAVLAFRERYSEEPPRTRPMHSPSVRTIN